MQDFCIDSPLAFIVENRHSSYCLKGQCHEIFYLWFFSSNCSSWAQKTCPATVSIFFDYSQIYSTISVLPRRQRHRRSMHCRCHWHRQKITHRCHWHQRNMYLPVSMTPNDTGVNDTQRHRCQWHPTTPVSMTPNDTGVNDTGDAFLSGIVDSGDVMHHRCRWYRAVKIANFAGVNDTGEECLRRCQRHRRCMHCRCHWHWWCTSRTFGSSQMPLKEQSVKKQAINRYYFSIASIQS